MEQREKKPVVYTDDKEVVTDTANSLKIAEGLVGHQLTFKDMKSDPKVVAAHVQYTFHDSDDEEDDTYETRKSLKTAEKLLKSRFFMTPGEKARFD